MEWNLPLRVKVYSISSKILLFLQSDPLFYFIFFTVYFIPIVDRNKKKNREDAYSRTGGIFIRDTARDTAYSLWCNEA